MLDFMAGVPGKLKTLTDRLSSTWAAKLDALRTGLTDARMGYLDKLNITGNVASSSEVAKPASQMTGIVKSIQHGHKSFSSGTSTSVSATVTIDISVDVSKSLFINNGIRPGETGAWGEHAYLSSSTQVTVSFSRTSTSNSSGQVSYTIVEFY